MAPTGEHTDAWQAQGLPGCVTISHPALLWNPEANSKAQCMLSILQHLAVRCSVLDGVPLPIGNTISACQQPA